MKKILLLVFFVVLSQVQINAQKESLGVFFGKPWFADADIIFKNYSLGMQYQNRFSQSFSYLIDIEYAQNNSMPDFLNNSQALDAFFFEQNAGNVVLNTLWSKINSISIGAEVSYLFVNNNKFLMGFNLGLGYQYANSSAFRLDQFTPDPATGQVIAYESSVPEESMNTTYYSLGIQFHYTFYKDYFIGLNPKYQAPIDGDKFFQTIPVYPNNYNITLTLGKRF